MARHGKAKSECCDQPIKKSQNGEWTEFNCTKCGMNVDEDGRIYKYTTRDYYNKK